MPALARVPAERETPVGNLEARTIRKLQKRLIPFLFLLYIVAFVDRINIGFAALTMNPALGISSQQYGLLTGIFFLGYFLFEIPSNLLLHKIGPRIWISRILITWGAVSALTCLAQNAVHVYTLRFLLGVAEAGFFPGIILYLTYWFRQKEQAQTVALFMTAIPIANMVGAMVSGLILDHVSWFGMSSWRWLFILEGCPAVLLGFLTYLLLPNGPADADFLSSQERDWIKRELEVEASIKAQARQFSALTALRSGRVWHLALIYFGSLVGSYGMIFWMPQMMKSLSARGSNTGVGFLTALPYVAGLTAMILVSRHSDRTLERRFHIALPTAAAGLALLVLSLTSWPWLALALMAIGTMGIESNRGPFWAVPSQFLGGFSAAAGIALINSIGNLGGFVGPSLFGAINHKTGWAVMGAVLLCSAALAALLPKRSRSSSSQ